MNRLVKNTYFASNKYLRQSPLGSKNQSMILKNRLARLICFLCLLKGGLAQENDVKIPVQISGNAAITNNGISLVPSFSLEQPAAIFNMKVQKGRFSFEPEVAFSLEEGRPWYQLYWLRYKVLDGKKFKLRTGAHLGLNFVKILDADSNDALQTERYLVGELAPSYDLSKNISLGVYYLVARGFDINNTTPLHFLTLNANFNNIKVSKSLNLEITPQVYFLDLFGDGTGYYVTSSFKIFKKNSPLSLSMVINQVLSTEIDGKDFLWNLTLTYSFPKAAF